VKILHLISSVNPADGGPIEGVKQLGATNIRSGHSVEVATLDAPSEVFTKNFPMPLHCFGPATLKYRYTPRIVPWLRAHHSDYDAVVVNGLWQFNSYSVYLALRGTSTPYYIYPHGMLDPWFKRAYPLKHLKKVIYWKFFQHRTIEAARAVFFTCEEERRLAQTAFRPYRCREMVVNYGTAVPRRSSENLRHVFLERFPAARDKRCFLFISRIHEKKGCDLLIRAFHNLIQNSPGESRDVHLIIAGPDQRGLIPILQQLAATLGIAHRITWTGMLEDDLKWGAFDTAEAFVLPSHQENFGIAVVEALACGVPVLISNQVNIWREIQQDGAGLINNDDQRGINDLLLRWIKLPTDAREKIRTQTTFTFTNRFEIHQAARSMIEAINSTLHAT
jgi:glycosyltransferase involved in cell wall biosynthesis